MATQTNLSTDSNCKSELTEIEQSICLCHVQVHAAGQLQLYEKFYKNQIGCKDVLVISWLNVFCDIIKLQEDLLIK